MGVKDIYAGSDVDLAILNPGEIIGWQEIITKSKDGRKALIGPIQIPDGEIAIKVVGNYMRSLILAKSGKVFTHYGSVYHGAKYANEVPQEIVGLENIVDCALGSYHGMALRADGKALCWGMNQWGQCSDNSGDMFNKPRIVKGIPICKKIAFGSIYSLALFRKRGGFRLGKLGGINSKRKRQ